MTENSGNVPFGVLTFGAAAQIAVPLKRGEMAGTAFISSLKKSAPSEVSR
ncbi:MAG: hypothetical protein LBQ79_01090 [Deltaproteobacteria bacterium]|nr:hypothetical protein [Deltaproteobacteria bacterium]